MTNARFDAAQGFTSHDEDWEDEARQEAEAAMNEEPEDGDPFGFMC